jgi:nicotinate-nucleotide--dimethylbenzimidazole phosphoribosyltransferase
VTGRGTGVDHAAWRRKVEVVEAAVRRERDGSAASDPLATLASLGGLEIAALVGVILGSVAARLPIVLDGFITGAAALVAQALAPGIEPRLIAGHRSVEPGHAIVLDRLRLRPVLDLDLRLGEGTGAALALQVLAAAVAIRDGMATFASAGVPDRP